MARGSALLGEIRAINLALMTTIRVAPEAKAAVNGVLSTVTDRVVLAPTAPQSPGPTSTGGGDPTQQEPARPTGPGLKNRRAPSTSGQAEGNTSPQTAPWDPNSVDTPPVLTQEPNLNLGNPSFVPGPAAPHDFDTLLAIYKADPNSNASQPVKRIMDALLYLSKIPYAQAVARARAAFDRLMKGGGVAPSVSTGGAGESGSGSSLARGPGGGGSGMASNTGATGSGGFSGSDVVSATKKVSSGVEAVVSEIQGLRRDMKANAGLSLRANGTL